MAVWAWIRRCGGGGIGKRLKLQLDPKAMGAALKKKERKTKKKKKKRNTTHEANGKLSIFENILKVISH